MAPACGPPTVIPIMPTAAGSGSTAVAAVTRGTPAQLGIDLEPGTGYQVHSLRLDVSPASRRSVRALSAGTDGWVRRLETNTPRAGKHTITFDGTDSKGAALPTGNYSVDLVMTFSVGANCGATPPPP
jgi:hypothetical protein